MQVYKQAVFPSSDGWYMTNRNRYERYKNGEVLQSHVRSAHKGEVLESCQACSEIQARMLEINGQVQETVVI